MTIELTTTCRVAHLPARPPASASPERADGGFAEVIQLAKARRAAQPIPAAVWDEMSRASRIADELQAADRAVRFHAPLEGGRVRAELVDRDERVLRPLALGEVVSLGTDEPPTAA